MSAVLGTFVSAVESADTIQLGDPVRETLEIGGRKAADFFICYDPRPGRFQSKRVVKGRAPPSMFARSLRSGFLPLMAVLAAFTANAATTTIKIAVDTDNNSSTGCSVTTGAGTFSGAEQLWTTT